MRTCALILALAFWAAPLSASAEDEPRQYTNKQLCRRMTKQIAHFENTVVPMAEERGNDLWKASTEAHIDRLKNRRADRCPEWGKQRSALARARQQAEQMRQLMVTAAKGAAKYFSGGAF